MAQFDVFKNTHRQTCEDIPYLLDVQTDLLSHLETHIVVPLILASKIKKLIQQLNLKFVIEHKAVIASFPELASISSKNLGIKITSLQTHRHEIINALDVLFTGV